VIELLDDLGAWREQGLEPGRAVVLRTYGSAPRAEGSVLLVADDGRIAGSVSGGCVEAAAAEEVARARTAGRARIVRFGVSDEQAWDVGLACGGTIDVLIEPEIRPQVEDAARTLGLAVAIEVHGAAVAPAAGDPAGPDASPGVLGDSLVIDETGAILGSGGADGRSQIAEAARRLLEQGRSGLVEMDGRSWFIETFPHRPRLVIVGAVQLAIPLVSMAHTLGYETVVIDARPRFASLDRFPHADRLVVGWPDEVAASIGLAPRDAVTVLSHDPKIDEPAITVALERGCRYVGAIGSRRTQDERRKRLAAAGVPATELDRVRGPIGLDLGGREPAETALAIMAEVVATRYGAVGGPLKARKR
jgi:xanthine dehydrogenase accessory factor